MDRVRREALRLEAVSLLEAGWSDAGIGRSFRVTRMSVNRWRRSWTAGGTAALASKGAGGMRYGLTDDQLACLQVELAKGPAAYGRHEDQRWTLARIAAVIAELFTVSCTVAGVDVLMHRLG
ncbi:helix-turn-helix domain-containing protein [Actinomadura parmotrematis]|uniref:helix-turn-helix domain-containing protein n=1 Tax=Actinomadura parmotrematis TaxID=2864039 RepID=UPI0027E31BC1|nr:winged helix-turn-helix domain-containing protein [Actinomadura parmotrematis]